MSSLASGDATNSALRNVDLPCSALVALAADLDVRLASISERKRRRKRHDEVRYQATLLAFTASIAKIALAQMPPLNGVAMAFGESVYRDSPLSHTALVQIREGMVRLGLIVCKGGFYNRANPRKSFTTAIRHTAEFSTLAREHGLRLSDLYQPPAEVIVLNRPIGALAVPEVVAASATILHRYHRFVERFDLTLPPSAWADLVRRINRGDTNGKGARLVSGYSDAQIYLTRKFTETYERGGRLYDGWWQNLPKAIRAELLIDGQPTVELDYARIHPAIIFADKGLTLPLDPYTVPGFAYDESVGKETFNRLLNAKRPIRYRPQRDRETFGDAAAFNAYRDAMKVHLSAISDTFQSDCGAQLQRRDSELALDVIDRCMNEGIPVYPIHDSFVVPDHFVSDVRSIMLDMFGRRFGKSINVR